jgi:hypothetical protein
MCGDCYDYQVAVLFNAHAADLWRRFITYLPRHLARRLGITQKLLRSLLRVRFVKVAEYQARGVVHFHAVIRLDAPGQDYQPPPHGITTEMLTEAIGQAAAAVRLPVTAPGGTPVLLTFGSPQGTDVRPILRDDITGHPLGRQAVANYIAKYTTKTLAVPGLPSLRIRREADIAALRCPAHYRRMITTAWQLGCRYRAWAHMLGLRRPLPDQIPPLLRHLRPAPQRPYRIPPRIALPARRPRRLGPPPGRDRRPGPAHHLDLRRTRPQPGDTRR